MRVRALRMGQGSREPTTHVTVELDTNWGVVARSSAAFATAEGIDGHQVDALAATIARALPQLARTIREHQGAEALAAAQRAQEEARQRAVEEAAARQDDAAARHDDAAWTAATVKPCTDPEDDSSCGKLRAYLVLYPQGRHAGQAHLALEGAAAAVADAKRWNAVATSCRAAKFREGCYALERYLLDRPERPHAAEAREMFDAVKDRLKWRGSPRGHVNIGGASVPSTAVPGCFAVVAGMRGRFRACYHAGLRMDPAMRGTVTLTAKIGPNGEVLGVGGGGGLGAIIGCLKATVAGAQFSPPEGGSAAITIPISFFVM